MSEFNQVVKEIKKLYSGLGWTTAFTHIRFFTAPYEHLEKLVPKKGLIVDLGCGYGIFSNLLGLMSSERKIVGIDLDEKKLEFASHQIPNVSFRCEDVTRSDLVNADCVLMVHLLHHLNSFEEQEKLTKVCYEKLRSGGKLIVCEIDRTPWWKYIITQLADNFLYPDDTLFYRSEDKWISFFESFGFLVKTIPMYTRKPFSHVTFVCTK